MQRERYENLKTAIEDARQARHDMRHHFNQISALAESGQWDQIKEYISGAVERIPNLDVHFCENRAADSVIGYYCALARREGVPFQAQADLPVQIPVNEIDMSVAPPPPGGRSGRRSICIPTVCCSSRLKTPMTAASKKRTAFFNPPSTKETASVSSPSAASQKRQTAHAHFPIKTAFSPQKL